MKYDKIKYYCRDENVDINIMEKAYKEYTRWCKEKLPEDLAEELCAIQEDENEIYNRFCKDITFGTSGLRAKMGAGTNRINSVTLRKATIGISRYLKEKSEAPLLIIGYDTRNHSKEYAEIVAEEFAKQGVNVCLFGEPTPVPVVSFGVRAMKASGGIMITASHNTREYNGYKVYDHFGNQIDDRKANIIERYMQDADPFKGDKAEKQGTIATVPENIKKQYMEALAKNLPPVTEPAKVGEALSKLRVCYTPLNGTGINYVPQRLIAMGMREENILKVSSQMVQDGNFATCPAPNPELEEAFAEALKLCKAQEHKPELILATDPDSDRLGVMVLKDASAGEYVKLSGNQVGEFLLDYVCGLASPADNSVAFKSHVSSPLAEDIAKEYGVRMKNVFTGFKNIAFEMQRLKDNPQEGKFLFGFEESLGYLYGDYTRDKDGIMAAQLMCLATADLDTRGKTVTDRLEEIYQKHGYIYSEAFAVEFENEADRKKTSGIMEELFSSRMKLDGTQKEYCYREKNMYCADFNGGHKLIVRPSGTEMKLKIYIFARDVSKACAKEKCDEIRSGVEAFLEKYDSMWNKGE